MKTLLGILAVVLVAVGVVGASLLRAPTYEASALVFVGQRSLAQGPRDGKIQLIPLAPTPETLQTIILEMTHAIDSRPVAEEAIQRLGLQMKPAELLDNLTIEQDAGTSFIRLTYEDNDPESAQQIVNTVGEVSSERISPIRALDSKFTATVWEKAARPENPVSPTPLRNGLLTLVIGLVLCAMLALALPRPLAAKVAGNSFLGGRIRLVRQGAGQAGPPGSPSEVERIKEQELLEALNRCGKLTAVEAALESSLSVEEANRILEELAFAGQLEVTVEDGKLLYSFWGHDAP